MVLSYPVTDSELFFRKMHFFEFCFGKESGIFVDKLIDVVFYWSKLPLTPVRCNGLTGQAELTGCTEFLICVKL
jgi:hypothetical protein